MARRGAQRLQLTNQLFSTELRWVASSVSRLTGWYLGLDTLGCRVLPGVGEILVIWENVDDSNLDGLRLALTHSWCTAVRARRTAVPSRELRSCMEK